MTQAADTCRLYLVLPAGADAGLPDRLEAALDAGDVACLLLPAGTDMTVARRAKDIAQGRGVAVLTEGGPALARALGADGVHIAAEETLYDDARAALGEDAIVGADAGLSRHMALSLAEKGADYIAFHAPPGREAELADTIGWWAEIVEVPCVAWDAGSLAQARSLAGLGADFVAVCDAVWRHPVSPQEAVRELTATLAHAKDAA